MGPKVRNGLTDRDLAVLARVTGGDVDELRTRLRRRPWHLHELLSDPEVGETVAGDQAGLADVVSPFLLFAVLAHRAAEELAEAAYVHDWTGPQRRLPVFDVEPLHEFVEDPARLLFVARLLASFATPERPPVPVDALDLEGLVDWLEVAVPADRPTMLRHLGDLSLFLAGVLPDSTGPQVVPASVAERLGRSVAMTADEVLALIDPGSLSPGLDTLESLGARWYRAAAREAEGSVPGVVADVAARFRPARRFLNHLADRHLHRFEPGWGFAA
jgi:hypothetical protein